MVEDIIGNSSVFNGDNIFDNQSILQGVRLICDLFQKAITPKLSLSDQQLVKPKCVSGQAKFLNFL